MLEQFLRMLGLAERAHALRSGAQGCAQTLNRGNVSLVILAEDAAEEIKNSVTKQAQERKIRVVVVASKRDLGIAIGKSPRAAIVVTDHNFGERLWAMSQESGGGIRVQNQSF